MNEGPLRILLVDDDEDDYILTHAVLNECYGDGVEVEWISSYDPARSALMSGRYQLCLLDYHLGSRTGLELLRETISAGCATPIILLTGNDDWQTDVDAMKAGAADYLVKGRFGTCLLERTIRYARGLADERQQAIQALRQSADRLQHNALHDSLTGLPSRLLLLDRLGQALARTQRRPDCRFGVLFLAIDEPKLKYHSLDLQIGEKLLIAISKRLTSCLRESDTVARLGEDEFVILMHDVSAIDDLLTVADRILRCFQAPFIVDAHELHTTVSMGIVSSTTHLASAENLVRNAGLAMLRARSGGKSAYAVFDEAMDAARVSRWLDPASSGAPAV